MFRLLQREGLGGDTVRDHGRRTAAFHDRAESGEHVSRWAQWQAVAGNCRENFEQVEPFINFSVSRRVFERLQCMTEAVLEEHRGLIEDRAGRKVPRDTHGNLHLGYVYSFPGEDTPGDLVVLDCIEFNGCSGAKIIENGIRIICKWPGSRP